MSNTLKDIYHLDYDKSNFNSGLISWYNNLIDKTVDELNVVDVSKMARQNILKEVAIARAIEIFLHDPFDGEMQDGDLLSLIISHGSEVSKNGNKREELIKVVNDLESNNYDFDCSDESIKNSYKHNIKILKQFINA
ncbi:contact-dependent growth inhibition system immunity protein [Lacrimispora sp.]|uniref:contact-dependent growth inhibition system immunity protein n=1 Tax=Lacrimispora sp. TaxID=2719234 RepID=UPI0028980E93|nr:contact-dependent growth inhibition system immunity protein [Lacrimispora sp.]